MGEINELATIFGFLTSLRIKLDSVSIKDSTNRKIIQKATFILTEFGLLSIEDLTYSWYKHGTYSQKLANYYYRISSMYDLIKSASEAKIIGTEDGNIAKAKTLFSRIKHRQGTLTDEQAFVLLSSLLYAKNYLGKNNYHDALQVVKVRKPELEFDDAIAKSFYDDIIA